MNATERLTHDGYPEVIGIIVERSGTPSGHIRKTSNIFAGFINGFISSLLERAYTSVRSIDIQAGEYQHAEADLSEPKFKNGHPIIIISMNNIDIAVAGLSFKGAQCAMTHAELSASSLILSTVS